MSFVVLYATDEFAVIKGDSRMCDDKMEITSEAYNKVCKINEKLILGYTGGVEFTLRVTVEAMLKSYKKSGFYDYVKALKESIIANMSKKTIKIAGGSFVVAGMDGDRIRAYNARCNSEMIEDGFAEGFNSVNPLILACGTCDKEPDAFAGEVFSSTEGTLEERLNNIIYKAADISGYVNKKISTVSIGNRK